MDSQLSLSIIEIVVLMLGAVILGFTIHFILSSYRIFKATTPPAIEKLQKELNEWKSRFYNELESREKEVQQMKMKLSEAEENINISFIESEEVRIENKKLKTELEALKTNMSAIPAIDNSGYLAQLNQAHANLRQYSEKINQLLNQIDIVKEHEIKYQSIIRENEELVKQNEELKLIVSQKESEVQKIRQNQELSAEMNSRLEIAYVEFENLQKKIQKLESQVSASGKLSMEYEDLREEYFKLTRDFEEKKQKYQAADMQIQELQSELAETENKLREANLERQQLQKKVAYLQQLNSDMQAIADTNKKLEGHIKRIGELESMLHLVTEERDQLARKQLK